MTDFQRDATAVLLQLAAARGVTAPAEATRAWLERALEALGSTAAEIAARAGVAPAAVEDVLRGGDGSGVWARGQLVLAVKAFLRERLRARLGDAYAAAMLAARDRAADAAGSGELAGAGDRAGSRDRDAASGTASAGAHATAPGPDGRDPLLDELLALGPVEFARAVANVLVALNHAGSPRRVHVAPPDAGGIDLIIFDEDRRTGSRLVVQAERRRTPVGVDDLRHLSGLVGPHVERAMMITTSEFTAEARRFAAPRPTLTLVDGTFLCDAVRASGLAVTELAAPPE